MGSISYPSGSISQPSGSISNGAGSISSPSTGTISTETGASFVFTDASIPFDQRITFARSTPANDYNSVGTLRQIAIDVARANANQDYNPSTLAARGFLIEAGATNGIRNPRCEGAVAPSTPPTNYSTSGAAGLTIAYSDPGSFDGVPYFDITLSGTAAGTFANINLETVTGVPATNGQTYTLSGWLQVVGGSTAGITSIAWSGAQADAGSGGLPAPTLGSMSGSVSATWQRLSRNITTNNASTAYLRPVIAIGVTNGAAINLTLRISAPQLELNAFATSLILPPVASPAATARGADLPQVATLSTIGYNSTQGSLSGEVMFEGVGSSSARRIASFNDGTTDNEIAIVMADGGSDLIRLVVTSGGVTQADISSTVTAVANTLYKWCISWNANIFRISVNSTAGTEDTSGTVPTVDRLTIGTDGAGANSVNGWVPGITYYPTQLSQAQMNSITA